MLKKKGLTIKDYNRYSNFMQLGDGFVVINKNFNIVFMNQQMINLYGKGVGKKCHKIFFDRLEPCKKECPVKVILKQEGELKHVRVFKHEKKDLYDRWFELTGTLAVLNNQTIDPKDVSQIMVMARNVTECKGFQEELEMKNEVLAQKNKQLESFVYTVSHDLKSPVFSIKGLIQAIIEDYGNRLPDPAQEYLKDIEYSADQMGRLIRDLLELSRIGRFRSERQEVPMSKIIEEVLKQIDYQLKDKNIELIIDEELPVLFCDKKLIVLALNNLLDNAIKFSAQNPHPRIEVRCEEDNLYNICSVSDNGIGIDKAYFNKIFDIFQTLDELKHPNSTGVGLTIVKSIVEVHDGRIWLESTKNEGTTFYFTIRKKR
ncbi:MAG: sensor histidine kinase [bacterium]